MNRVGYFLRRPALLLSLLFILLVVMSALFAPWLTPFDPDEQFVEGLSLEGAPLSPNSTYWLGTDLLGRDLFSRLIYGARTSLLIGVVANGTAVLIGVLVGLSAGYLQGRIGGLLMRFTDIFLALPSMLLMIVLNTILKPGMVTLILVLSLFSWASVARITRAETMSLKERDFVIASKNLGAGSVLIAVKHILPNILGPVIVAASLGVASAILTESSLSFLGLGISIPHASWGSMLQEAQTYILDKPLLAVYPGLLILLTVLSFNILGDVLRSALEPKIVK